MSKFELPVLGCQGCDISSKLLRAFVLIDPVNVHAKLQVRCFNPFSDNRGNPKNLGSLWIRPRSLFSEFLMEFCSMEPMNVPAKFLKSAALSFRDIGHA